MHINTSHGLHSHYVSSFQTDFLQADTEVEIKKKQKGKVFNETHVVLANDSFPPLPKWAVKTARSFTIDTFVFAHLSYPTARGERANEHMVMQVGTPRHSDGIQVQIHHPLRAHNVNRVWKSPFLHREGLSNI